MNKSLHALICFAVALSSGYGFANEIVHDPEFVRMEKEFGAQWQADEKQVREKLEALERKFGKKPNIVYIMADDVGYTELGSYGEASFVVHRPQTWTRWQNRACGF